MAAGFQRWPHLAAASALVITAVLAFAAGADASPAAGEVSFTSEPSLFPKFGPNIHDYVVRCDNRRVTVRGHTSGGWQASIGNNAFRSGDFTETVPLNTGRAFTINVRRTGSATLFRYYVRCLPNTFPKYTFTRYGPVSPKYFSVNQFNLSRGRGYAIIYDDHGVPIWWDHVPAGDTRVLPDGNILWFNFGVSKWEVHRVDGSRVRTLTGAGRGANPHDLQLLDNGDHLIGGSVDQPHVDTSAYGGSSNATVITTELQQVSPTGQLVWDWKSQGHISLAETGPYWPWAVHNGYDIQHWNSIEPAGNSVIASFRNLDAVYKIDKGTGDIVWKLGGTTTPKSLTVKGDPHGRTLAAQHDARLLPDGTVTVFDNRTNQGSHTPEAVRFRIDEQQRTAALLQSITDPAVHASNCCGSARRLGNGDWLIDWGGSNPVGAYKPNGSRTFLLRFDKNFSYRAEPVPSGAVSAQDLRQGMDAMYGPGPG
jgi:arylsulfotransferase ASST